MMAVTTGTDRHPVEESFIEIITAGEERQISLDSLFETGKGMAVLRHRIATRCHRPAKSCDRLQQVRPPLVVGQSRRGFVVSARLFKILGHSCSTPRDGAIARRKKVRSVAQAARKYPAPEGATAKY